MSGSLQGDAVVGATVIGSLVTGAPFVLLKVGEIVFYDHEVPQTIAGGGEQMLAVHKYPGGIRTVDALGPDDREIEWGGLFLDATAEPRCHALDAVRRQGEPTTLYWSSFLYQVVIRSFTWSYERSWQIRYQLSLMVVQDLLFDALDPLLSAGEQVVSDTLSSAGSALGLSRISYGGLF